MRNHLASQIIFVLVLTGCVSMPVTSMFKLRKMDPLAVDPAQLKVAIRADERIHLPKDGVHISLKFDAEDGSLIIDDTYVVEVIRNPILTPELFDDKATWESVTVLQLSDSDAQKMIRVQSALKPYIEGRAGGSLSFGINISGVCVLSPISAGNVLVDVFMQSSDNEDFFAVTRNFELGGGSAGTEPVLESLSKCVENYSLEIVVDQQFP